MTTLACGSVRPTVPRRAGGAGVVTVEAPAATAAVTRRRAERARRPIDPMVDCCFLILCVIKVHNEAGCVLKSCSRCVRSMRWAAHHTASAPKPFEILRVRPSYGRVLCICTFNRVISLIGCPFKCFNPWPAGLSCACWGLKDGQQRNGSSASVTVPCAPTFFEPRQLLAARGCAATDLSPLNV